MSQTIIWGCAAALVFILLLAMLMSTSSFSSRQSGEVYRPDARDTLRTLIGPRSARGAGSGSSCGNLVPHTKSGASDYDVLSSSEQVSTYSQTPSRTDTHASTMLPGLPLCPLLIVPDGTRLACIVQNDVRRQKQEIAFDIHAVPARGGAPLFRVRVTEEGTETQGIYVETLSGREQLAVMCTEELWRDKERPTLSMSRPWGLPYGTIQKGFNEEYVIKRGTSNLLTFSGDFAQHSIRVTSASSDATVATVTQFTPEEYQVQMQARTDAGLVILGLLAIDKCELEVSGLGQPAMPRFSGAAPGSSGSIPVEQRLTAASDN